LNAQTVFIRHDFVLQIVVALSHSEMERSRNVFNEVRM